MDPAKYSCVAPSMVGVKKPETVIVTKLKGRQNSGKKATKFSVFDFVSIISGNCEIVSKRKRNKISSPIISSTDHVSSNVPWVYLSKESKLIGITLFTVKNNVKKQRETLTFPPMEVIILFFDFTPYFISSSSSNWL